MIWFLQIKTQHSRRSARKQRGKPNCDHAPNQPNQRGSAERPPGLTGPQHNAKQTQAKPNETDNNCSSAFMHVEAHTRARESHPDRHNAPRPPSPLAAALARHKTAHFVRGAIMVRSGGRVECSPHRCADTFPCPSSAVALLSMRFERTNERTFKRARTSQRTNTHTPAHTRAHTHSTRTLTL